MQTPQRIALLLFKYLREELSGEESEELENWINESPDNENLFKHLTSEEGFLSELKSYSIRAGNPEFDNNSEFSPSNVKKNRLHRIGRFGKYAAITISLILTGAIITRYFVQKNESKSFPAEPTTSNIKNDLPPGENRAILTLSDGRKIKIDSTLHGSVAVQSGTKILRKEDGQIAYVEEKSAATPSSNIITTPFGGQIQIELSDGTKVWLNAGSSLKYPTAFATDKRSVELEYGEAYFEVSKNPKKPFSVMVKGMNVEVLGTHFNVNSYGDEPSINTTLFEGSVKVQKESQSLLLKPSQQSRLFENGKLEIVTPDNPEQIIAWKNARFQFRNESLESIMRQIARWYDVEIKYQCEIPKRNFSADLSRNKNLSAFLKIMELSDIHFKLEGKKLTVIQ
ncbi:MAG: FecR family protein [Bacteroidetes bacterium]|nr:FecR family protein [Bacteroidota bacterium]